ncbi:MAG: hypothetical protein ACFE9R_19510 [Candidatus Hermodarchaeota archaeon]
MNDKEWLGFDKKQAEEDYKAHTEIVTGKTKKQEALITQVRKEISEFYHAKVFSRATQIGIIIFFFSLALGVIFGYGGKTSEEQTQRLIKIIIFPFYLLILAFVIDVLRWREFSEWGALGVLITDMGIIFFFLPGVFFAFPIFTQILSHIFRLPSSFEDYIIMIPLGLLLIILGVSLHRTDWDDKIVNLATMSILYIRNYQYRAAIGALLQLIKNILQGLFESLITGLRHLPIRIFHFVKIAGRAIQRFIEASLVFIGNNLNKIMKGTWINLHWIGIIAIFFYIGSSSSRLEGYFSLDLLLIMVFFLSLGLIFSNQERATTILRKARTKVVRRVVSTYSMLSGSPLELDNSIFCSRCLRGIQTSEFESLILMKGNMDPACPFCGYQSWTVME